MLKQLKERFFNPIELIWFDPDVDNPENKGLAELIKSELKIKAKNFLEIRINNSIHIER